MAEHMWGPELTWNFYCGYDSYADWAKKVEVLSVIHEEELADGASRKDKPYILDSEKRAFALFFFVER